MDTSDNFLAVCPVNGLANRFRVLVAYRILADYLKLPYLVRWDSSVGFDDTKLSDLLHEPEKKLGFGYVDKSDWNFMRENSFKIDENVTGVSECGVEQSKHSKKDAYTGYIMSGSPRRMTSCASNLPCWSFGSYYESAIPNHKQLYKNLARGIEVSNYVKQLASESLSMFGEKTMGVHIRMGDATSKQNPKHKYHSISSVSEILQTCDRYNDTIYLSTDDEYVLDMFCEKLGNKIIYRTKKFVESNLNERKLGQLDAMVDMYLLSRTNSMLPTSPSSFGKFASDMGGELYSKCNMGTQLSSELKSVICW